MASTPPTSSSTSSLLTALGGGSGVDMVKLAQDLAEARFMAQKGQLESRSDLLEAKISAASTLKNQLSQLSSALGDRIRNGDLAPTASVANASVARASVLAGGTAQGSYTLEVSQLAASFGEAVAQFGNASTELSGRLEQIGGALDASLARSDEQLAYYVAQAREVVDLSLLSQKQVMEELQQLAARRGKAGSA